MINHLRIKYIIIHDNIISIFWSIFELQSINIWQNRFLKLEYVCVELFGAFKHRPFLGYDVETLKLYMYIHKIEILRRYRICMIFLNINILFIYEYIYIIFIYEYRYNIYIFIIYLFEDNFYLWYIYIYVLFDFGRVKLIIYITNNKIRYK